MSNASNLPTVASLEAEFDNIGKIILDAANTFVFTREQPSPDHPFPVYQLVRRAAYEGLWRKTIDRWRRGELR